MAAVRVPGTAVFPSVGCVGTAGTVGGLFPERLESVVAGPVGEFDGVVYGFDIETCTDGGVSCDGVPAGLDPRRSPVISAAVYNSSTCAASFFSGEEPQLLSQLEGFFASAEPGLLATWNGANFDLPYLVDRFAACGVPTSLRLSPSDDRRGKYGPLVGHPADGYVAMWGAHRHIDVAFLYRERAESAGVRWGLKPVAELEGIDMVHLDASAVSDAPPELLEAYNVSDARATALLALASPLGDLETRVDPPV